MQKELVTIIGTFFLGIFGKIFWDWVSRKTAIPKADDGFMDMADLKKHCSDQQARCTAGITNELKLIIVRLENRLENGDKLFQEVQKTLKLHGRVLGILYRRLERDDSNRKG